MRATSFITAVVVVCVLGSAGRALAQQQPPPPAGGPLVLEPMHNGFVIAPEVKVTELDKKISTLAGAYGGWIKDDQLFIGGAAYGLADRKRNDRELGYGGLVIGWFFDPARAVSVSAKTLVGFGEFSERFGQQIDVPSCRLPEQYLCLAVPSMYDPGFDNRFRVRRTMFVAEPEVDVVARVSKRVRLTAGAGYRAVDEPRGFESHIAGATGTFSVQFTFGD